METNIGITDGNYEYEVIAKSFGITRKDVNDLEGGFENFYSIADTNSPYFKLGAEIYQLSLQNQ
jgi:hypothetical protein